MTKGIDQASDSDFVFMYVIIKVMSRIAKIEIAVDVRNLMSSVTHLCFCLDPDSYVIDRITRTSVEIIPVTQMSAMAEKRNCGISTCHISI